MKSLLEQIIEEVNSNVWNKGRTLSLRETMEHGSHTCQLLVKEEWEDEPSCFRIGKSKISQDEAQRVVITSVFAIGCKTGVDEDGNDIIIRPRKR